MVINVLETKNKEKNQGKETPKRWVGVIQTGLCREGVFGECLLLHYWFSKKCW